MVKLMVLYGKPEDPSAFDVHYAVRHASLAERVRNLKRLGNANFASGGVTMFIGQA